MYYLCKRLGGMRLLQAGVEQLAFDKDCFGAKGAESVEVVQLSLKEGSLGG